ncbi:MAG: hypothetical protein LWX83_19115, partial [Anaerolineae bacterium]|nr:hypothetical protein [Anaerolineae bacterium]
LSVVEAGNKPRKLENPSGLLSVNRLVVLVPNEDVDEAGLSRQIWMLASHYHLDVLLLSVVHNNDESMSALRRLTTLSMMTHDSHVKVDKKVMNNRSWLHAVKQQWGQTDMILCPAELFVSAGFGKSRNLSQLLSDSLKAPVYTFSGLYTYVKHSLPVWVRRVPYWLGFALILAVCFYFEVEVDHIAHGWVGQLILVLVVTFEIGLIYLWNLIAG